MPSQSALEYCTQGGPDRVSFDYKTNSPGLPRTSLTVAFEVLIC